MLFCSALSVPLWLVNQDCPHMLLSSSTDMVPLQFLDMFHSTSKTSFLRWMVKF